MNEIISVLRGHILRLALLRTGVAVLCTALPCCSALCGGCTDPPQLRRWQHARRGIRSSVGSLSLISICAANVAEAHGIPGAD
ncbi:MULTISPECIES: hypothetical protein [unclassified Cryobacterium]|uniref:hypothetical protein n=1 Tax=unclassified Cryobacterium TaxID=2649013 RepID=UPI0011B07660|nr:MULTISPECIES: hypothetical protein [unclassified Cryobacterium]